MVQVVANQRLFARGVMVKDGGALERLAEVDHVVFDKTGTLTAGVPRLAKPIDADLLAIAAAMAQRSRHPYAQAIAAEARARQAPVLEATGFSEHAGSGLEGRIGDTIYRLGRPGWALCDGAHDDGSNVVLTAGGRKLCGFAFEESPRAGAREAIDALRAAGLGVEIVSGDHDAAVRAVASRFGVPFQAEVTPAAKVARIAALATGHKVLMVGDGLNDAPALAAAHVSMAVASATDVGRSAADIVFLREGLDSVADTLAVARAAARLVRQNLWLAAGYNALAIPVAVLGLVTPLIAAIAMSASSLLVVANALRLARRTGAAR
jgi:Cu2+-exporting ATPase